MEKGILFSLLCVFLDSCTYVMYNWEFWKGRSKPNRVTWGLWTWLALLNATSYLGVSHDVIKTFLAIENATMCGLTFTVVCFRGKTEAMTKWEWVTAVFGLTAGAAWIVSCDPFHANNLLQIGTIASFVPLFAGLWKDPRKESSAPWFMWSVIYSLLLVVVLLRWKGAWHDLVYPVNFVLLHVAVFILTLRRTTRTRKEECSGSEHS